MVGPITAMLPQIRSRSGKGPVCRRNDFL